MMIPSIHKKESEVALIFRVIQEIGIYYYQPIKMMTPSIHKKENELATYDDV